MLNKKTTTHLLYLQKGLWLTPVKMSSATGIDNFYLGAGLSIHHFKWLNFSLVYCNSLHLEPSYNIRDGTAAVAFISGMAFMLTLQS